MNKQNGNKSLGISAVVASYDARSRDLLIQFSKYKLWEPFLMNDINSQFCVQVISINDVIRSENLEAKLTEFGLKFQISPGVTPREIDFRNGLLHSAFLSKLIITRDLRIGEVGCSLAHRNALMNFINSDQKFGFVFEDDAEIIANFNFDTLMELLDSNRPIIIALGWIPGFAIAKNPQIQSNNELIELITAPTCTFAYAINRPAAKLIINTNEKVIDVADWPIYVLNKTTFYSTHTPWVTANHDPEFSTIGERLTPNLNSPMRVLVSRIRLASSLVTLMLLSKTNKLKVSPKQIMHRLIIQPMLYEYGLSQVDKESTTNEVMPLPSKFQKFGLAPFRWTRF